MGGFLIAWLVGLSLHIAQGASEWKYTTGTNYFPLTFASPLPSKPGQLLVASGIYVGLAILAEIPTMQTLAIVTAWGYNIAIGLTWAQNYQAEKTTEKTMKSPGVGTLFWNPPVMDSNSLFPTGKASNSNATLTSAGTSPGNPSTGGPLAA